MIKEFLTEINNKKDFNSNLNDAIKTARIGCIIIYLTFIVSTIIYPISLTITLWIVLIAWFSLIMFSDKMIEINEQIYRDGQNLKRLQWLYKD